MRLSRIPVWLYATVAAASLLLVAHPVAAQSSEDDPPTRVARLNFSYGQVSFQPAGESDWVAAVVNRPLTSGDSLWVDAGGRAELHVGSTAIRLGQNTSVTLLEVSDRIVQLRVAQGSVIIHARHVDDDDVFEVDAPNLAFSPLAPGEYRVDVSDEGTETATSVLRGRGQVTGGGRTYTVVAGQRARFAGLDSLSYEISEIAESDQFSRWASDRDRREDRAQTANYVSREVTGYEDLDTHGQWSVAADYGPVWRPVGVPIGWAPYHYGHWAWIEPWGWTWVDDQPWGFAPFHYGRWAYYGGGWVWIPGPVAVRPVYAPALVVFVGGGPHVGWFPLGPGEVFVPAYRVSPRYVTVVNVTNTRVETTRVTTVYNSYTAGGNREVTRITYANQQAPGGVTAVSRETFVSARPVGANTVRVDAGEMSRAPVTHVAPVAPVRGSVMGAGAAGASAPPAAVQRRSVVGNRVATAPPPPFKAREAALNEHPGQPPARSEVRQQSRSQTPATAPSAQTAPAVKHEQTPTTPAPRSESAPPPRSQTPATAPSAQTAPAVKHETTPAPPAPRSESAPPPRTPQTPAPQPAPSSTPQQPAKHYEAQGTEHSGATPTAPTPQPAAKHEQPAAQPPPQPPPSHPNVQPAPPPQPRSQPELQKGPQQQQQQPQPKQPPPKTNKPADKDKEKEKPSKP